MGGNDLDDVLIVVAMDQREKRRREMAKAPVLSGEHVVGDTLDEVLEEPILPALGDMGSFRTDTISFRTNESRIGSSSCSAIPLTAATRRW